MACANLLLPLLSLLQLFMLFIRVFSADFSVQSSHINSFNCSDDRVKTCNSLLYHHNHLPVEKISSFYSVNASEIRPISGAGNEDYLINIPCSCKEVNGTKGYFYDTFYQLQVNDTFFSVSNQIYSGAAWKVGGEERNYTAGKNVTMHLLCGCVETDSQIVVTYSVQQRDTLPDIADLLSAHVGEIERLNTHLGPNPGYIEVGWLLYVPMELNGIPAPKKHEQGF